MNDTRTEKKLAAAGWTTGDAKDFFDLFEAEARSFYGPPALPLCLFVRRAPQPCEKVVSVVQSTDVRHSIVVRQVHPPRPLVA